MQDFFYLIEFDLFRLGNSSSSRLDHVRVPKDLPTTFRGPIEFVNPGLAGISLMDEARLEERISMARRTGSAVGHVWKIPRGVAVPPGLVIRPDPRDKSHLFVCPAEPMPIEKYKGLLLQLAASTVYLGRK